MGKKPQFFVSNSGRALVNRAGRKPIRAGRSALRNRPSWNTRCVVAQVNVYFPPAVHCSAVPTSQEACAHCRACARARVLQAPQCEHAFCAACIREWLARQPTCPVDRAAISPAQLLPVPRILRNMLARLLVSCDNVAFGCSAILKLDVLAAHLLVGHRRGRVCNFSSGVGHWRAIGGRVDHWREGGSVLRGTTLNYVIFIGY